MSKKKASAIQKQVILKAIFKLNDFVQTILKDGPCAGKSGHILSILHDEKTHTYKYCVSYGFSSVMGWLEESSLKIARV